MRTIFHIDTNSAYLSWTAIAMLERGAEVDIRKIPSAIAGDPLDAAYLIKKRIKKELGFTVNTGISTNMLLAKMGSELKKPDRIHTLYLDEMEEKMWPLPVSELFMVGRATAQKLKKININTIGDLAKSDPQHMKALLRSHGLLVWSYANGIRSC